MNMEEIENYISELESMFELSELEEHSRNILKVGIYIKQLQQENSRLKEELEELKHKHYLIQGGRGNGKTYLLHLQQENQELKEKINNIKKIIIDNSYNEFYGWFNELREERVIEIVNILDIKKDIEKKEWNK